MKYNLFIDILKIIMNYMEYYRISNLKIRMKWKWNVIIQEQNYVIQKKK